MAAISPVMRLRDAMPDGGRLTIETSNVDLDQAYAQRHIGLEPGSYVMLAVSDTGIGMDREQQSHIFEPFFTTKGVGKGTGLGLATVYGIVKQSGGHIWVYSEPGQGTTVKIYFSRVQALAETGKATELPAPPATGTETVLLVEDEESVREVAGECLRLHGYQVLEAKNGEEALAIAHRHESPLDLMLTDVVMPGMSGQELARRLAAVRPEIKVLYMSGYTDDAVVRHGLVEPGVAFLQKPFRPADLARKVREVLTTPARVPPACS